MTDEQHNLKILLLSPLPPPAGGIATWTEKYLEWTKKQNIEVINLNTAVIGKRAHKINSSRSLWDESKRTIFTLIKLIKKIKGHKPNVVHLNTPCGKFGIIRDYLCASYIKRKDIPLIIHYRCNIEDQIGEGSIQKYFFRKISKLANVNLVLNTPSNEYMKVVTGNSGEIIANFIEEEFILNKPKKISQHIKKIVFIGHVQITKGAKEIIQVASCFPDITFTLAGPVSNEIDSLKIPQNVNLLGSVDLQKVRETLLDGDVFLFPSYTEGFSNALLEAMAVGLPVITTAVGANEDMIEEFGGILVHTKNIEDIKKAILELEEVNVRENASNWNLKKVKENYSISSVMNGLVEMYKSLALQDNNYKS